MKNEFDQPSMGEWAMYSACFMVVMTVVLSVFLILAGS